MAITRERKEELLAEYQELVAKSEAIIFSEYRGMNNAEVLKLRRVVREAGGVHRVAKMTLLKIALNEHGYAVPTHLEGVPFSVSFCVEDIAPVAKAVTNFAKDNERFNVWGAYAGRAMVSAKEVEQLASLPALPTLRAQLVGLLDAPASQLVGVLQGGIANVVNVVSAYAEKAEDAA